MSAAVFDDRSDPGRTASIVLAALMHVLLLAVLLFGVRWQNKPPEAVQVELWEPPTPTPAPVVETPRPAPKVEAPPPPKPEPEIPKPEIVEKKAPPPPKPKPEPVKKEVAPPKPKPEPKPVPKAEPLKPRVDDAMKRMQAELARDQASLAIDRERAQIKDQLARDAVSGNNKALETWVGKIQMHIRSRINKDVTDAVAGNPDAVYVVTLLPTYEVLDIRKIKSSGNRSYDDEIERAIRRASPLPRPDKADVFERQLRLTFRPKDPI